jgi:hypothetical protein
LGDSLGEINRRGRGKEKVPRGEEDGIMLHIYIEEGIMKFTKHCSKEGEEED